MSWLRIVLVGLIVLVVALPLGVFAILWVGPTGPVPKGDPITALNAEHARIADNAAALYNTAYEQLVAPPDPKWLKKLPGLWAWDEPDAQIPEWIEQNAECIEQTRAAAGKAECWFEIERGAASDFLELPCIEILKSLAKLNRSRAMLAAEHHDLTELEDALRVTDGIARHTFQQPFFLTHIVGVGMLSYVQELILEPLTWEALSDTERKSYLDRIETLYAPPPSAVRAIKVERDEMCWNPCYRMAISNVMPTRFAGEVDRYITPALEFAALSADAVFDPTNECRTALAEVYAWQFSWTNPIRGEAGVYLPNFEPGIELRARLIATQRGNRTAGDVLAHKLEHGRFPRNLDALDGDHVIDPFTGEAFIYRPTENSFILYSVGYDRDDDGGAHDRRLGERHGEASDGDFVFWPLPAD